MSKSEVLELLRKKKEPITVKQMAKELPTSEATLYTNVEGLREEVKNGNGRIKWIMKKTKKCNRKVYHYYV